MKGKMKLKTLKSRINEDLIVCQVLSGIHEEGKVREVCLNRIMNLIDLYINQLKMKDNG